MNLSTQDNAPAMDPIKLPAIIIGRNPEARDISECSLIVVPSLPVRLFTPDNTIDEIAEAGIEVFVQATDESGDGDSWFAVLKTDSDLRFWLTVHFEEWEERGLPLEGGWA